MKRWIVVEFDPAAVEEQAGIEDLLVHLENEFNAQKIPARLLLTPSDPGAAYSRSRRT